MNTIIEETTVDTRELIKPVAKTGLNLEELLSYAQEIQSDCKDYTVTANSTTAHFNPTGDIIYLPDIEKDSRKVGISRYALGQLCSKLGVPVKYIEKCFNEGQVDLAAENVNTWLSDYGKTLFMREYKNSIRGVLSSRYSVVDTPDILSVLADTIDPKQYATKGFFISPERFHARIVQREQMINVNGEDLFSGIQIDSSDVGRSILKVQFFIFKQVCTNGMCLTKGGGVLFEQKHVGITTQQFRDGLSSTFGNIPMLTSQAEELINRCATGDRYHTNLMSEDTLNNFVSSIRDATKLSEPAVLKVINTMNDKYSDNSWGLVNAITEVAQDYTLEKRLELEKVAGDILSTGKFLKVA